MWKLLTFDELFNFSRKIRNVENGEILLIIKHSSSALTTNDEAAIVNRESNLNVAGKELLFFSRRHDKFCVDPRGRKLDRLHF